MVKRGDLRRQGGAATGGTRGLVLLGFLIAAAAASCGKSPPPLFPAANVILISIDTLRADHLGCYGYPRRTSPHLDAFAAGGVLFENAVTPRPKTTQSVASMLTGLYPYHHGVRTMYTPMETQPTLPSVLREKGFVTGAFVSNWVLKPEFSGFDRYFDTYDYDFTRPELNRTDIFERSAGETNEKVFAWLDDHRQSQFFLWVHYMDPHGPYLPPEGHRNTFSHRERKLVPLDDIPKYQVLPDAYREGEFTDIRDYIDRYDSEISYTDTEVHELLQKVEALGILEETIIVITSDHGESLDEHDYYLEHGQELYEPTARVPLVMRFPQSPAYAGLRSGALVSLLDIFPTILASLGGGEEGLDLDGTSLLPLLEGRDRVRDDVFIERHDGRGFDKMAIRSATAKLILKGGGEECFDLSRDGEELDPGSCDERTFVDLAEGLQRHVDQADRSYRPSGSVVPDAQDREILKSLGYIH